MPSIGGIVCHTYVYEKHMPCLKMKNIRLGNKLFFLIKKSSDKKKFPQKKIHRGQFSGGNFPRTKISLQISAVENVFFSSLRFCTECANDFS